MAGYSVQTYLNDIATAIHGTTVNKVPGIYNIANRAARALLLDVDPKETQRIVQLSQVFNDVFDYPAPPDVKGDRIVDIRPQAGRMPWDVYPQGYAQDFDANKNVSFSNKLYTQWNTGVKTLRIEAPSLTAPLTLCDTSTITGWTATAGAQNISFDGSFAVAGGGDITFDLANGPITGSIQVSSLFPVDVTNSVNVDTLFFWVYLPTASGISTLTLRWGSDITANYYTASASLTQQGTAFQNGWNLIAMPWVSATKVGTPILTSFDSVQLIPSYNGTAQTGLKFCNLTSNDGFYFEAQYYSKYLFRDPTTNAFQETISAGGADDNKLVNLDTESYNLFFNKGAYFVAQSLQGADSEYDAIFWDNEYKQALQRYRAQNPSEAMLKGTQYYRPSGQPRPYGNWIGRNQ